MEPASSIIAALGGHSEVARITGKHRSTVWKWTRPKSDHGTGGAIPITHAPALLKAAAERGVCLTADAFIPGDGKAA